MSDILGDSNSGALARDTGAGGLAAPTDTSNLGDILLRILDQGIVIAGDIQINLLDIELLTIKLRLLVASVDTARDMGINWWEGDRSLRAAEPGEDADQRALAERVAQLERRLAAGSETGRQDDG
jgi:hypothetical protein